MDIERYIKIKTVLDCTKELLETIIDDLKGIEELDDLKTYINVDLEEVINLEKELLNDE